MWKHEAKDLCPDIQFARVAELRGRADLTKYREAGKQVVDVLSTFSILLERASIDEAYLDLTEAVERELSKGITNIPLEDLKTTHIVGGETADFISYISSAQDTDGFCRDDLKLAVGAIIVERMRASIFEKTGYRCSAGIAQNKILAKLVCGLHKPNKQTILPGNAIPQFLSELPLKKIKRLGGKFGRKVSEKLNVNNVGDLLQFSEEELSRQFDSKTGIIAVNYLAREKGVTRQMRGDEAKERCPNIELPRVPQVRGKADLTKYREAGKQVAEVLKTFTNILERASIDEAYLDLTEAVNTELNNNFQNIEPQHLQNTFIVGHETSDFLANIYHNQNMGFCEDNLKLAVGGVIVEKIRAEVYKKTGYICSAGIAHNKILAKLVCGLHKPNKQTILPQTAVPELFTTLPIRKIKNLGGKFGHTLSEKLNINYMGELEKFSEKQLVQIFDEKTGRWLYNISRGIDKEEVQVKLISKSIGCCKRFPGRTSLLKVEEVEHWMGELSSEIADRLEEDIKENNRKARLMTVSFSQLTNQVETSSTRAVPLKSYEMIKICQQALEVLRKYCQKADSSYHITFLGLSISNFEDIKNVKTITSYFGKAEKISNKTTTTLNADSEKKISTTFRKDHLQNADADHSTEDDENSIYSDTTLELEEDPSDYIFFNDTHSESVNVETKSFKSNESDEYSIENQELIGNIQNTAIDSFGDEMNQNDFSSSNSPVLRRNIKDNEYDESDSSKEIDRDFDTSKIFEGHYGSSDEESERNILVSEDPSESKESSKTCEECGEVVPVNCIVSHMDFHLAIKLSQEKFPSAVPSVKQKPIEKPAPNKKRKMAETLGNIGSYCRKPDYSDEFSEVCTECNKRINIGDMATHSDYHAAKRLHLELNSPSSKTESANSSSSTTGSIKRNKKLINGGSSITSFFKPIGP
ncbi:DNApol-eta isoform X2 [Harmonia axyridis]|nr:DNApol-eta isoform X2 [Harmonia axyridis]